MSSDSSEAVSRCLRARASSTTCNCAATATRSSSSCIERPSIRKLRRSSGNKDIKTEDLHRVDAQRSVSAPGRSLPTVPGARQRHAVPDPAVFRARQVRGESDAVGDGAARQQGQRQRRDRGRRPRAHPPDPTSSATRPSATRSCARSFELDTPHFTSLLQKDDRYCARVAGRRSRAPAELLHGSRLRELPPWNRRRWPSRPTRSDMFITVNVHGGDRFTVSDAKITGDTGRAESELLGMMLTKPGQIYSRKLIEQTTQPHRAAAGTGRLRASRASTRYRPSIRRRRRSRSTSTSIPATRVRAHASTSRHDRRQRRGRSGARCASSRARTCRTRRSTARSSASAACPSSRRCQGDGAGGRHRPDLQST